MSFTSKNLQTTRRSGLSVLKGATLFFLGMSCVMFFTKAYLTITTEAINARQVIGSIFLSEGGDPSAATGISLDGSGGNAYFAGKVGIGVEGPQYELDVAGTGTLKSVISPNIYFHNMFLNSNILYGDSYLAHSLYVNMLGINYMKLYRNGPGGVNQNNIIFNDNQEDVDLQIKGTGDAELLYVDASQNMIGMGTDTPAYLLDISDTARVQSTLFVGLFKAADRYASIYDDNKILKIKGATSHGINPAVPVPGHDVTINGGDPYLTTSMGDVIIANEGGNVGIGIDVPNEKLHVYGKVQIGQTLRLYSNDNFQASPTIEALGTTKPLVFVTSGSENMIITPAGNVGIGTINPTAKLHVDSDVKIGNNLSLYSDGLYDAIIQSPVSLKFNNGLNTRMTISSVGNVGIGTITPSQKLEVAGSVKTTGGLQIGKEGDNTRCNSTGDVGKFVYYNHCSNSGSNRIYTPSFRGCVGNGSTGYVAKTFLTGASWTGAGNCPIGFNEDEIGSIVIGGSGL